MGIIAGLAIRDSVPDDWPSIEALYPEAFPEEDLLPLVRELLRDGVVLTSLVATEQSSIIGHAVFSPCEVAGTDDRLALLGPLAVAPAWQRRGVGSALVRAGLSRLEAAGVARVMVLGDPAYYARLGFAAEQDVSPPYPLPDEWQGAWQSRPVCATDGSPPSGRLRVPPAWRSRSLWAP